MRDRKLTKQQLLDNTMTAVRDLWEEEVALALQIMDHDGHNVAHFGINGCFLFSEFDRAEEVIQ